MEKRCCADIARPRGMILCGVRLYLLLYQHLLIHIWRLPHKHNDMAAASLEEGINPQQGSSCKSEEIQGILPQSATFISPLLSSPM